MQMVSKIVWLKTITVFCYKICIVSCTHSSVFTIKREPPSTPKEEKKTVGKFSYLSTWHSLLGEQKKHKKKPPRVKWIQMKPIRRKRCLSQSHTHTHFQASRLQSSDYTKRITSLNGAADWSQEFDLVYETRWGCRRLIYEILHLQFIWGRSPERWKFLESYNTVFNEQFYQVNVSPSDTALQSPSPVVSREESA